MRCFEQAVPHHGDREKPSFKVKCIRRPHCLKHGAHEFGHHICFRVSKERSWLMYVCMYVHACILYNKHMCVHTAYIIIYIYIYIYVCSRISTSIPKVISTYSNSA